ncbi:splicing regulator SDE2 [Aplochiton taeniatus]
MEVFISGPSVQFSNASFFSGASVRDLVGRLSRETGIPLSDFYVKNNGRLSDLDEELQDGGVYRLEPRLCGGKGGFGSMLRALGAQIEKTTNREACRDLSGRRLRDVNHEKEMADWLKKQADREAEKEQRRMERLQRKLAEPKHHFTDPGYEQQCHDLSERLEDSVLKGMQASSSGLVKAEEASASLKREAPRKGSKSSKKKCFWTGVSGLENSSEEETDEEDSVSEENTPSSSRAVGGHVKARPAAAASPDECVSTAKQEQASPENNSAKTASAAQQGATSDDKPLLLGAVGSVEELEAFGLEKLKAELMSRGLKCGGTLTDRAARLFSIKGLAPDQIDPSLLSKPSKGKKK